MMIYATFNDNGFPSGFYTDDVHGGRMRAVYGEPAVLYGDRPILGVEEDGVTPVLGDPEIIGYGPRPVIGEEPNPDCTIPADATAITAEQRGEFMSHPSARRWDGSAVVPYEPPARPASAADIVEERSRRLALGFDYDFGDARGVHRIGTAAADQLGWNEVTTLSNALIALGDTTTTITAVTDTGPVEITALEWQSILVAAGQFRQPIWAASFALQAADPIPADFAADHYWP